MNTTAYKLDRWDVLFRISMIILILWVLWAIGRALGVF